jgi:hypothetical protein
MLVYTTMLRPVISSIVHDTYAPDSSAVKIRQRYCIKTLVLFSRLMQWNLRFRSA